jgi:hypothetical protein
MSGQIKIFYYYGRGKENDREWIIMKYIVFEYEGSITKCIKSWEQGNRKRVSNRGG